MKGGKLPSTGCGRRWLPISGACGAGPEEANSYHLIHHHHRQNQNI
jgi:hypothetical protein